MRTISWLRAARNGFLKHDWAPLVIERGGHRLELSVSADAARVGGHRENIGARSQQFLADALGALLPTAVIFAERFRQASVKCPPILGSILAVTAEQASETLDKLLVTGQYAAESGPWCVAGPGKTWTIGRRSAPTIAIAEGEFSTDPRVPAYFVSAGRVVPSGCPTGPAEAEGVFAVRVPGENGVAHPQVRAGQHDLHQGDGDGDKATDYSQWAFFALDACVLDGAPDSLARIYQDPELCALVSEDGKPLPARHPGVEALADAPEWKQILAEDAMPAPPATELIPAAKTPATILEVWADFSAVLPQLSRASKLVLMAHTFGESGGYQADWNWNFGNYKAKPGGATDWQFFACNEYVTPAQLAQAQKDAPARDTLTPEQIAWFQKKTGFLLEPDGPSVVVTKQVQTETGPMYIAWFFAPHPWACFAAFRSRRQGLAWYAEKMQTRFAACWPAVLAADVHGFAVALHSAGYFTDLPEHYEHGLMLNYPLLDRAVPA